MRIETKDLISVSDASQMGVSKLVNEAASGRTRVVLRNNEPTAVVTSIENFDRLQNLDDVAQDLRLLALAIVRSATDNGVRHDLDDVLADLDIDISE